MKVLFISNGYPPQRWAGTETYTAGLAEGFTRLGHEVHVLCTGEWDSGDGYWNGVSDDVYNGVHIRRLNLNWKKSPNVFRYLYDNPVVADYVDGFLKRLRPEVVHVTSCETLSASVLRVVKAANLPLILSLTDFWFLCPRINLLHGDGSICDGRTTSGECTECSMLHTMAYRISKKVLPSRLLVPILETVGKNGYVTRLRGLRGWSGNMKERKEMLQRALTSPDVRITSSKFVRDIFELNGVTAPIQLSPYGHDLAWLNAYRGKTESDRIRFGYIGQILPAKGLHLALEALRTLPPAVSERCSLTVYGNVDRMPSYGRRIRELGSGLPNVSFQGIYPHTDSARVFSGIDVLLVPSIWYDFPLIIGEAHAANTPVIATNLGGMAEVIDHEKNGLLFERADVNHLAEQLQRVIVEPGLIGKLQGGISAVKTIQQELIGLLDIYRSLIA